MGLSETLNADSVVFSKLDPSRGFLGCRGFKPVHLGGSWATFGDLGPTWGLLVRAGGWFRYGGWRAGWS